MTGSADPYDLERFVEAQNSGGTLQQAMSELRAGRKTGHWIWFVFPQIAGLGSSPISQQFSISSLDEARAYLRHPVLGSRLNEAARIVADSQAASAAQIFGSLDAQKLRSSMTLFAQVGDDDDVYEQVLAKYFGAEQDPATLSRLG